MPDDVVSLSRARVLVFIYTHSEEATGDLYLSEEESSTGLESVSMILHDHRPHSVTVKDSGGTP